MALCLRRTSVSNLPQFTETLPHLVSHQPTFLLWRCCQTDVLTMNPAICQKNHCLVACGAAHKKALLKFPASKTDGPAEAWPLHCQATPCQDWRARQSMEHGAVEATDCCAPGTSQVSCLLRCPSVRCIRSKVRCVAEQRHSVPLAPGTSQVCSKLCSKHAARAPACLLRCPSVRCVRSKVRVRRQPTTKAQARGALRLERCIFGISLLS